MKRNCFMENSMVKLPMKSASITTPLFSLNCVGRVAGEQGVLSADFVITLLLWGKYYINKSKFGALLLCHRRFPGLENKVLNG